MKSVDDRSMKEQEECIKFEGLGYPALEEVVNMIGGKWKLRIIYKLGFNRILRYGELKKELAPITHKMLSTQLKELESDGIIIRKEYPQIPPKVEYFLSQKGLDFIPVFREMLEWKLKYMDK